MGWKKENMKLTNFIGDEHAWLPSSEDDGCDYTFLNCVSRNASCSLFAKKAHNGKSLYYHIEPYRTKYLKLSVTYSNSTFTIDESDRVSQLIGAGFINSNQFLIEYLKATSENFENYARKSVLLVNPACIEFGTTGKRIKAPAE